MVTPVTAGRSRAEDKDAGMSDLTEPDEPCPSRARVDAAGPARRRRGRMAR